MFYNLIKIIVEIIAIIIPINDINGFFNLRKP